jgi:predicted nucleic acid-binding protein
MIKVVIDTNVLISAALTGRVPEAIILLALLDSQ